MKIAVLGGGESGVGAAVLAHLRGHDVWLSDLGSIKSKHSLTLEKHGVPFEQGMHSEDRILASDEVIISPGIPLKAPIVQRILEKGIPIISEIEFAWRYTAATCIAITGTNGKTTTTLLTYHLLKNAGLNVGLAGNVGHSFAYQVATERHDYYVLELSSYQLDGIVTFRPKIAVLLNITPDHMDRYNNSMAAYVESKFRITLNQGPTDYFIYNHDDTEILAYPKWDKVQSARMPISMTAQEAFGAYLSQDQISIVTPNDSIHMSIYDLALNGKHNVFNSMAAGLAAKLLDLRKESIRDSLADFQQIEHRLEHVVDVNGVEYINDSKATNVNSTWYALESMTKPVIWICGGVDKGNDYEQLIPLVKDKVKAIICLGTDNSKIINAFSGVLEVMVETTDMARAVKTAYNLSDKNDVVLLSPACASFDLFENYEDRGNQFKQAVREL
jgi:UDP-N-acetylmuramoylalanine--D-glutamate ligase